MDRLVPSGKHDFSAVERLAAASDEEVIKKLPNLLEWLQDMNWPVARPVADRIKNLGIALVEPLRNILNGDDAIWKYDPTRQQRTPA